VFDAFARDAGIIAVIGAVGLIILAVQLVLCGKAKKLIAKLLPAILLVFAVVAFYTAVFIIQDRAAIGFGILAVITEVLLFFDAIAWGVWAIAKFIRRNGKRRIAGKF